MVKDGVSRIFGVVDDGSVDRAFRAREHAGYDSQVSFLDEFFGEKGRKERLRFRILG